MGEHMSHLERLGEHVAGSLEKTRAAEGATARIRAKLAGGDAREAEPRVRVRRSALVGVFALAAAAALFLFGLTRAEHARRSELTFTIGGASTGVVGAFLTAPPGRELPLAFSDGTSIHIASGGRARIASVSPRGAHLLVESGVIRAEVTHRSDTEWLVDAGPFEVKVTGTRFDVAWEPAEQAVIVTLHEGSVVVTGCTLGDGQRVSAGQQLRASCKTGASTIGLVGLTSVIAGGAAPDTPENLGLLRTTPAAALPDAPRQPSQPASAPTTRPSAPARNDVAGDDEASASELLARANADRFAGRFDAAAEALDTVRRRFRGSDAAASAAFELGRIAFDARHDFRAAGDWFDTYLRERPSGALAREALGRAIESRHRGGDAARAGQLATRYVAIYPDGPHSALARRLADRAGATP